MCRSLTGNPVPPAQPVKKETDLIKGIQVFNDEDTTFIKLA